MKAAACAVVLALVLALGGCCPAACWFLVKSPKPGEAAPASKTGPKATPTPRVAP